HIYILSLHDALPICNTRKKMIAMMICPINFCKDVNPRFRFKAILMKSSKKPNKPYPSNTNNSKYVSLFNSEKIAVMTSEVITIEDRKSTRLNSSHVK